MGLHQNTGKQLMSTVDGRAFAESMKMQKFMSPAKYQEAALAKRLEQAKRLGDISEIVVTEVQEVIILAKRILEMPGCSIKDQIQAGILINKAARTYNELLYIMYRESKEMGVEVTKPAPKNPAPTFEQTE